MTTDQIAAELIDSLFGDTIDETDRRISIGIAKSAIEKATEGLSGYAALNEQSDDTRRLDWLLLQTQSPLKMVRIAKRIPGGDKLLYSRADIDTAMSQTKEEVMRYSKIMAPRAGWIARADKNVFRTPIYAKEDLDAHNATLRELKDANDNLFKVARKHSVENQKLKKARSDDTKRLDWLDKAIREPEVRSQFHQINRGPYLPGMTLVMFNGRSTEHISRNTLREAIDAAMSQTKEKE